MTNDTTHRLLLVEDDTRLAALIVEYLSAQGFDVQHTLNGNKIQRLLEDFCPHLLILDVNLPGKDGLQICRDIRQAFHGVILLLTARSQDADQIQGLESGADDFVAKPVDPRVLLARIRALLRRQGSSGAGNPWQFGGLHIDPQSRSASLSGQSLHLTNHEYELLALFAQQPGQVLSREYLFSRIYGRPYDGSDRTVDVRISQLRKKLNDDADRPARLKTIWGRGYLFVPDAC
jgi:two-component system, OmpR family, response regulator RstA